MASNFLWITRTEENLTYYAASARKSNLSLRFASDIAPGTKKHSVFFSLSHELSHYFQWYFLNEERRSDRSLEIQASKYATRITNDYCLDFCKKPDSECKKCYEK